MPYKYYKRKRKKHWGYKEYSRGLSLAGKALAVAYTTKKLLNVERKFIENTNNAVAMPNTATIDNIALTSTGTSSEQRTGEQIKIVSINLRYYININASATNSTCRVMLVLDRQPNGATYALSDLLENASAQQNIVSPLNLGNKFRFRVLYNRVHQISINGRQNAYGKIFKKCQIKVRYGNVSATIASLNSNSLSLVFMSDEATNTPLIESSCRLRFIDN